MTALWYCLILVLVASVPFSHLFAWSGRYLRRVKSGLQTPRHLIHFSWTPFWAMFGLFLTGAKGFAALAVTSYFFSETLFVMAATVLVVVGHYASIKINFGGNRDVVYVIFGALLFLHWGLAMLAALLFLLTSVFLDDLRVSSTLTSVGTLWLSFSFDLGSPLAVFFLMGTGLLMMFLEGKFESPLRVSHYLRRRAQSPWL